VSEGDDELGLERGESGLSHRLVNKDRVKYNGTPVEGGKPYRRVQTEQEERRIQIAVSACHEGFVGVDRVIVDDCASVQIQAPHNQKSSNYAPLDSL